MENNYTFEEKLAHIKSTVLKHIPVARYIYLFGSHAYGNPTDRSDIDIYVVTPDEFEEDMFLHSTICRELANNKIYEIDLHLATEQIFDKFRHLSRFEGTIYEKGSMIHAYR